jgi:biopolymer transport protein ExbB
MDQLARVYQNALDVTTNNGAGVNGNSSLNLRIGDWPTSVGGASLTASIDEFRIATGALSADRISTINANGNSPSTFYQIQDTAGSCVGYSLKRTITTDHTKVPNTDQSSFPFLFAGTYSWLATAGNGGDLQNASGFDVCFASDSSGTTALAYDTDYWTDTSGASAYWILIPTVSHTADTVIYVFYGKGSVSTSQATPALVWGPSYKSIYHLGNGTTLATSDSGIVGNNLTKTGTVPAVTGQIGGGASFGGTGNYLSNSSGGGYPTKQIRTFSVWFKFNASPNDSRIAGYGDASGACGSLWSMEWTAPKLSTGINGASHNFVYSPDTSWHYYVSELRTSAGSNTAMREYLDGSSTGSNSIALCNVSTTLKYVGMNDLFSGSSSNYNGSLDEMRIRTGFTSGDWVSTEFANQSSPSTFYTISSATPIGTSNRRMSQVY